ncbi:MAG: ATP-binding cassette domain-containing protein [Chloroflexi bacterium]|nr:ATP-binding cassette domain-containing protein [Chloroflexota bacterium]
MDIVLTHFTYCYSPGEKPVLDDISLHISAGEWLLISGRSGSGKTTLAYAIAGILQQRKNSLMDGRIEIAGMDVSENELYKIADVVGLVQQNADDQFCALNVADEMAFGLENKCVPPDEMEDRIRETLKLTGCEHLYSRQLFELSGGEKQKIAIASILALHPTILILDEPTSNLDLASTRHIFEVLRDLHDRTNLTVIIVEHKIHLFASLFERCIYLEEGKIQYDGKTNSSPLAMVKNISFNNLQRLSAQDAPDRLQLHDWTYVSDNGFKLSIPSLYLKAGHIVALMGDNGSGKSSLLKTLAGILQPASGTLRLDGQDKDSLIIPQVGMVFQNADEQLFTSSVKDEMYYALQNLQQKDDLHGILAHDLLVQFGLNEKSNLHPHRLSYGEKKRLNIASNLVFSPAILLLDEIFIGQDGYQVNYILERLHMLCDQGATIILAIHDPALMYSIADEVIFLENGELRFYLSLQQAVIWWQVNGYRDYIPEEAKGL